VARGGEEGDGEYAESVEGVVGMRACCGVCAAFSMSGTEAVSDAFFYRVTRVMHGFFFHLTNIRLPFRQNEVTSVV